MFHSMAGTWWANSLFMLGLLGIGVALTAGVAMRIAASSGVLLVAGMWLATFPVAQFSSAGEPTGSNNPFVDDHVLEALVMVVLALTYAGTTWGLGRRWARIPSSSATGGRSRRVIASGPRLTSPSEASPCGDASDSVSCRGAVAPPCKERDERVMDTSNSRQPPASVDLYWLRSGQVKRTPAYERVVVPSRPS